MRIGTIIFTKDCGVWRLRASLDCNLNQERLPDEILVIDFGSTIDYKNQYKSVIEQTGRGDLIRFIEITKDTELFHPARIANVAIEKTTSDIICFADADALPGRNSYRIVEEVFTERPYSIVMCERLDLPPESNSPEIDFVKDFDYWCHENKKVKNHPAPGSFQCLPVVWLKDVGGFNEKLIGWGGYDVDIQRRARRSGFKEVWLKSLGMKLLHIWHPEREYRGNSNIAENARIVREFTRVKILPSGEADTR